MAKTVLTVDVSELAGIGERLGEITGEALGAANVKALNQVAQATYSLARDRMISGINLNDAYLQRRMRLNPATLADPRASITTLGDKGSMTQLRNYNARQVFAPLKNPKLLRSFNNRGKAGVPQGQRQIAVDVEVTRGSQKRFDYGFMLPLKRGDVAGGNGLGVFTRSKDGGKLRRRMGPSPYQLFAYQIDETPFVDEAEQALADAVTEQASAALQKALGS